MRPNENRKIYFTWSSPNWNFDEQVEESYPRLNGDFTDDESSESVYDVIEKEPKVLVDGDRVMIINGNNDEYRTYDLFSTSDYENDRIADQPDFLFYHFPIHYILICFGFTLLFTMLFGKYHFSLIIGVSNWSISNFLTRKSKIFEFQRIWLSIKISRC